MLGPEKSPPFIHAVNASVGVGFMLGSLIIRPFLPDKEEDSSICGSVQEQMKTNFTSSLFVEDDIHVDDLSPDTVPSIVWPFLIIAVVHVLTGLALIVLGLQVFVRNWLLKISSFFQLCLDFHFQNMRSLSTKIILNCL